MDLWPLKYIPDHLKTQEMCDEAVDIGPRLLEFVPDHFKTQEMCDKALRDYLFSLRLVPDWFVTRERVCMLDDNSEYRDDDDDDDEDNFFKWYDGYKKRKAQKTSIKEEFLSIDWYPSRYWDWCISEDEKRDTEALRA